MTRVEELLRRLHQRYNTVETYADLCALLEAGRAEGAEKMKETIRKLAKPAEGFFTPMLVIPASILTPEEDK